MEEEKKMPDGDEINAAPETPTAYGGCNESTPEDLTQKEGSAPEVPETEENAAAEELQAPTESAVAAEDPVTSPPPEEGPVPPAADWRFGVDDERHVAQPPKRHTFWVAFASVFAVCILMLGVTLWLGDGGFEIVRNVFTERIVYVREYDSASGLLTPQEAADAVKRSTVTVMVRTKNGGSGVGSGFVYTADGYICTNQHVIDDASEVQVVLPSGEAMDAVVVGSNAAADLAVLKIEREGLVPVTLGSSADLLVGDDVVAIGSPAKLDYAGTTTFGKVSYPKRLIAMTDETGAVVKKMTLIQTDVCVNPGNSGGPLADLYGHVVGVVVMKLNDYDGIGFAIPMDGAKIIIDAIIERGSFTGDNPVAEGRCLLGVTGIGLTAGYWYDLGAESVTGSAVEKPGYFQMPFDGVYVAGVSGVNAVGKLMAGDIIVKIDGLSMYTIYDVINQVNRRYAGETVRITVMRPQGDDYKELTVDIVLLEE